MSTYNLAQTFYIDPNSVNNAASVFLTSINLFFKNKPSSRNNSSGIDYPGVSIFICETENNAPKTQSIIPDSLVRLEYASIASGTFGDAALYLSVPTTNADIATKFSFDHPINVMTGKSYAILIKFDDPAYALWYAKQGDRVYGTNTPFQGISNFSGSFFQYKSDGTWTPISSQDLKFDVSIASFTSNSTVIEIVNKDYEFLTIDNATGVFAGGERVFANVSSYAGNVSVSSSSLTISGVTGTGYSLANLSIDDYVVLVSGTNKIVRKLSYVNSTAFSVNELPSFSNSAAKYFKTPIAKVFSRRTTSNTLFLTESNANSTFNFAANTKIVGELSAAYANISSVNNFDVNKFLPELGITIPAKGYANLSYDFSYSNGTSYIVDSNKISSMVNYRDQLVSSYNGLVMSRTNETANPTYLYSSPAKSGLIKVAIGIQGTPASGIYESPYLYSEDLDIFAAAHIINNDLTLENTSYGNAKSKHITKQISFDPGKSAEDILAYTTAYKPAGTNVAVFAKIHNTQDQEAFNDKEWTLLVSNVNSSQQISSNVSGSFVETAYNLPSSPPTNYTANGVVTVSSANAVIVGSGTFFSNGTTGNSTTSASVGDLIKVYSPLFPQNFFVASVVSVTNTTVLTIDQSYTNNSILGTGFAVDVLAPKQTAFLNNQNMNIVRYYDSNMAQYDTFDTMQYKIVLLSNNQSVAPRVADFRAIGVSA